MNLSDYVTVKGVVYGIVAGAIDVVTSVMGGDVVGIVIATMLLAFVLLNKYAWGREKLNPEPKPEPHRRGEGISLLVPFRSDGSVRMQTWKWLREYWEHELPGAQLCVGTSFQTPFCKTEAFNGAACQASGDVFVLLDADCYLDGDVILECAENIRRARRNHRKLWFIPYRRFYRMTKEASREILESNPRHPLRFTDPPPRHTYTSVNVNSISTGHWWGALIQIMPREAFELVGGCDERFSGWGGEDVAMMMAVDTLYSKHKTTPNGVMHLWHPSNLSEENPFLRMWHGQDSPHANDSLEWRYHEAAGDRDKMMKVIGLTEVEPGEPEWEPDNEPKITATAHGAGLPEPTGPVGENGPEPVVEPVLVTAGEEITPATVVAGFNRADDGPVLTEGDVEELRKVHLKPPVNEAEDDQVWDAPMPTQDEIDRLRWDDEAPTIPGPTDVGIDLFK